MALLQLVFVVVALWAVVMTVALALVSGIGAAAASADRNARRLVRIQHAAATPRPLGRVSAVQRSR
ncbi:MAG: hypothetical protein JHC95_02650 [Solirubrobacteraceae bacterium]|nr:hypothetical protein [Solirubrobacteraceae bacterium]